MATTAIMATPPIAVLAKPISSAQTASTSQPHSGRLVHTTVQASIAPSCPPGVGHPPTVVPLDGDAGLNRKYLSPIVQV